MCQLLHRIKYKSRNNSFKYYGAWKDSQLFRTKSDAGQSVIDYFSNTDNQCEEGEFSCEERDLFTTVDIH